MEAETWHYNIIGVHAQPAGNHAGIEQAGVTFTIGKRVTGAFPAVRHCWLFLNDRSSSPLAVTLADCIHSTSTSVSVVSPEPMADEPGTSRAPISPPATITGATPMATSEAAVRGLIREEVAAAIAAAFQTPGPRSILAPGELHVPVHNISGALGERGWTHAGSLHSMITYGW